MDPVTTIDPAEPGAAPDAEVAWADPDAPEAAVVDAGPPPDAAAPTTASRGRARLLGALLGAVAGLVAIAALYAVARVSGLGEWVGLALLVGEDGVFSLESGAPFAWVVPPLAAGIVGALTAPGAARGVRWSGWWMGFLTYGLGILVGALLLVLIPTGVLASSDADGFTTNPLSVAVGFLVLSFVGAIIASPILALCVVTGIGWAAIVRRLAPIDGGAPPGSRPIVVMGIVAVILAVLWLMVTTFLDILVQSQLD